MVQKKIKELNDSIPFVERAGESLYEKESREADEVLAKERAARKASLKRRRKSQRQQQPRKRWAYPPSVCYLGYKPNL